MARFIVADLTEPSSIAKELEAIVPNLAVPVQPLLEGSTRPYAMFKDYWKYDWVLPVYRYEGLETLPYRRTSDSTAARAHGRQSQSVDFADLTRATRRTPATGSQQVRL